MKKLIFLLVLGLLVVSCGKPSSAPVVETSPTEKIEEPTPTPVLPIIERNEITEDATQTRTPTPVPPTQTPEPTPTPAVDLSGCVGSEEELGCPVPDEFCGQGVIEDGYIVFDLPEGTPLLAIFDGQANLFESESGSWVGIYLIDKKGMTISYYTGGEVYLEVDQVGAPIGKPVTKGEVLGTSGPPVPGTPADHSLFLEVRIDGPMVFDPSELVKLFCWLKPTAAPPPPPQLHYVGLSAAEVQQLREQCLKENPDSLCLPLPVDPTQPGVEVIPVHAPPEELSDGRVLEMATIAFRAPVGTVFVAPYDGQAWGQGMEDATGSERYMLVLVSSDGLELTFSFPKTFKFTPDDFTIGPVSLGTPLFTIKYVGSFDCTKWRDESGQVVRNYQVFLWTMVPVPEEPGSTTHTPLTEDDLLQDEQGRIVYIKP